MNLTTEQVFTLVTITLTAINAALIFLNLKHNRKKDFQEKLYNLKLDAYNELNDACYKATLRLDINSTPFVQIYDFKTEEEWSKYCEKNMGEHFVKGFEMQKLTYKYSVILPSNIVDKYHAFTNYCLSFVTTSYHFDTGLIIENQDRLWDLYVDLLNEFRSDLEVDIIDEGLRKRIASKI